MEHKNIYFVGIGGIGMSAIARFFLHEGRNVAGYDRTVTPLTRQVSEEGAHIHYDDDPALIPTIFRDRTSTLVIYTPAVPVSHKELNWFRDNGFIVMKRSEVLGVISSNKYVMAVAGTHGKTSVSTMAAWLFYNAGICPHQKVITDPGTPNRCGSAILGGISKNFDSNLILGTGNTLTVEADEFDRSFLRLFPDSAVITSTDADHLDIYGTHEQMKLAFSQFASQVKTGGSLIVNHKAEITPPSNGVEVYSYSLDLDTDYHAANIECGQDGLYSFDIVTPDRTINGLTLGIPGLINVENAVAAIALISGLEFDEGKLRTALAGFSGVRRRFEFYINTPELVYMDDYAHHPQELAAAIGSIRKMFPGRRLTAIFQPHLYSRTKDNYRGFAQALSQADDVVLIPIYPARELPMPGIDSQMIGRELDVPWVMSDKEEVAGLLSGRKNDVVVTFGAGNIDAHCGEIYDSLNRQLINKIR